MKVVLHYLSATKWSIVAFVGFELVNAVSLGMLGMALYGVTFFVLDLMFPPLDDWGPNGWPLLLAVGATWPLSFLVAGPAVLEAKRRGWGPRRSRVLYLLILWLGALISWMVWMALNPPGA